VSVTAAGKAMGRHFGSSCWYAPHAAI